MSQLLQNKIRWLLGISALALIMISLIGGVVVYRLAGEVGNEAVRGTQTAIALNRDMNDVQLAFRSQVQEWKDLLLRGRDPQLFQEHYRAFRSQHDEVQASLKRLADQMTIHGFSTAQVSQIEHAHLALLARYEVALHKFPLANNPDNYRQIDELVRGIDRKVAADLEMLDDAVQQHVLEQTGTVNDKVQGRHLWQLSFVLAIMLGLFPLVNMASFGAIGRITRRIQEEKERFHVTLNSIGDAVVVADLAGNVEYLNPVGEAMTGWTLDEARGRPLREIFNIMNEDTRKIVSNPIEIVLREGYVVGLGNHTMLIARNGSECAIEDSAAPVRDRDGKLCGVVMVFHDAAPQRQAKRLLHESEARLRATIETAMDAVVQMDDTGTIIGWNSQAENIFGWTSEEAVGRVLSETIIPPQHREAHVRGLKRYLLSGEGSLLNSRVEVTGLHRDGHEFPVELAIVPLKMAGKYEFSAFVRDITQRKQAEEELRLRAQLLDSVSDTIFVLDLDGNFVYLNEAAWKTRGYTRNEMTGLNLRVLDTPKYAKFIGARFREIMENGRCIFESEHRRKDGSVMPVEVNSCVIELGGRKLLLSVIRDITERKRYEEQLQNTANELMKANAQIEEERVQLAARVAERTAQLLHANRAKDSFLATMSHEIRTPLSGLLGMMELISLSRLDGEQREMLQAARDSGRSLLRIVNDILDWSKIEAGKLELAPQAAAIPEIIKSVVSTYSPLASEKGLLLRQQVDSKLGAAHVFDPLRLSQILNNFTSNAIKFTQQGRVEISAELIARHEGVEQVRFCVEDSGVGINPERQAYLFQHYEQASADTARMYGGTGLGLAICRSLAELMEGAISVESTPGSGSVFCLTVSLPVASPAAQRDLQLRQAREDSSDDSPDLTPLVKDGKSVSVLVVDDHPVNRTLLRQQLELLGVHAEVAAYGIVALSLWWTGRFDLIITDCHMPEMDGYELTRSIREMEQHDGRQRVPIIAWTANVLAEEKGRCRAAGMDDMLIKPTELADLRAMLSKWLAKTGVSFSETLPPEMISVEAVRHPPSTDTPIDFSVLKKIATSHAAQVEVLQEFNLHCRSDIADLKEALKDGNPAAVARSVHRIKGASRMVGALELEGVCAAIEKAVVQGDLNGARVVAGTALNEAIERIEAAIGKFIGGQ